MKAQTADGANLIFVFSLPRTGSTLLQRIIATQPDVATASEPWILLPWLYTLRENGVYAEYGHRMMVRAIEDFYEGFLGGRDAYLGRIRQFALVLYDEARGGRRFFLDKTPRYHLVADEIMELFPAARIIFLWRQPLAVAASVIESFGAGRWNLDKFKIDLYDGLRNIVGAYGQRDDRCIAVRYEDLVLRPERESERLFAFLGIRQPVDPLAALRDVRLTGRMGDQWGTRSYERISTEPLEKWTRTMANPLRRRWGRQYVEWIGRENLAMMGYDSGELLAQLNGVPLSSRGILSDAARRTAGYGYWRFANRLAGRRNGAIPSLSTVRHQVSGP